MPNKEDSPAPERKAYTSPKLVRYGNINEITRDQKFGSPDGDSGKKGDKGTDFNNADSDGKDDD